MKLNNAVSVEYNRESKTVVVSFADGSQSSWPVRLLEMVERTDSGYTPISASDDGVGGCRAVWWQ
jgi:hypothetical protein